MKNEKEKKIESETENTTENKVENGTENTTENEILAGEIILDPDNTGDAAAEIEEIEQELKNHPGSLSKVDYAAAVLSGLVAGMIDAAYVDGAANLSKKDPGSEPGKESRVQEIGRQIEEVFDKIYNDQAKTEKGKKPLSQSAVKEGILSESPEAIRLAMKPNALGLVVSILLQMSRGGLLHVKDDKIQIRPDGISRSDGNILIIAAVFVGILKWLENISSEDQINKRKRLRTLTKLCALIRAVPAFPIVVLEIDKWQTQLLAEMISNKKEGTEQEEQNMGIEKIFYSFFTMMAGISVFNHSGMREAMEKFRDRERIGAEEDPGAQSKSRQEFPVMINEVLTRTLFFAVRLTQELIHTKDVENINWDRVIPFGNRDIERMLDISTMTLSAADTADAAIRAGIDARGESVLFSTSFVTRFNKVAAGRSLFAVNKEISNEGNAAEHIRQKRQRAEEKTARAQETLQKYQDELENKISEFMAEDMTEFLHGFGRRGQGSAKRKSGPAFKGNVKIKRVLGKKTQDADKQEADDQKD